MKTNSHWKSNGYNRRGAGRIIDADGHVRETDEQIMEYMPAGYRSRREAMLYFPLVPHHGWHRSIPANDFRYQDFRVPDWREWASKLDEGNIELTVLYPTRFMHIGQIGNPRYAVGLCRAYNDFLAEQFLTQDRCFRGMALLPLQDVSAAVKELRRAVKNHGMVGGILPAAARRIQPSAISSYSAKIVCFGPLTSLTKRRAPTYTSLCKNFLTAKIYPQPRRKKSPAPTRRTSTRYNARYITSA